MLRLNDEGSTVSVTWDVGERWAAIEFDAPHLNDDVVLYTVRFLGNGLSAAAMVVSINTAGFGLPYFIEKLADDFRGWDGTKTWENADRDLAVSATWSNRGHVSLDWRLTPSLYDKWSAHVVVEVEAGEEMSRLARGLAEFFALDG